MSNVYRLKEIARILDVESDELKGRIAADPAFAGVDPRVLDGRRFNEEEFAALAALLRERASPAPVAAPVAVPVASPAFSAEALDAMKGDLVRAIYAGDRRAEAILSDLRRLVRRAEEGGETGLRDALGRIALHFDEVCQKLNRQTKELEAANAALRELANAVKRIENLESSRREAARSVEAKRVAAAPEPKGEPLAWHERLVYELFLPWKLRGRV